MPVHNACFLHLIDYVPIMETGFEKYPCEICGKPSKNFVFAAHVCNNPECLEEARIRRGGPGGHMKRKAEGKPIIPIDLDKD